MTGLQLRELSADTALAANSLELLPGQEQFETPVTYANAGPGRFFRHVGFVETGVTEYGDTIGSLAL